MSDGDNAITFQILNKLGEVQNQLGALGAQTTAILAEQGRASAGRSEIYARLEALALKAAEVDRIAPLVDKHEIAHQRGAGVGHFIGAAWAAVSGGVVAGLALLASHYLNAPPGH
jgi:hypothetical protein